MKLKPIVVACMLAWATHAVAAGKGNQVIAVEFTPTPAPRNETEMANPYTRSSAIVTYASGGRRVFPLAYQVLFQPGDAIGGGTAGLVVDQDGRPLMTSLPDEKGKTAKGPFYAYAPDANSLIRLKDQGREKLFLITHYEYHTEAPATDSQETVQLYGQLPMTMNLTTLNQERKTGSLKPIKLAPVNVAPIDGLWIPCAASLTPWNTHLAGEEYEPNARQFENTPLEPMNLFRKTLGKLASEGGANPYRYGHLVEVKVLPDGRTEVVKRYAMGRLSSELAEVMPDERTAYMGDDGRDTMLFMFVADQARDLSAGTLYAARWEQLSGNNGGSANLRWVHLGHANQDEVKSLVDRGIKFSEIFDVADAAAVQAEPAKYGGFKPVFVYEGQAGKSSPGSGAKQEATWLKVKPGMEQAAAFLESRRYGALLGASSEFTKMEGTTHNAKDRKLYVAMSYIEAGMIADQNGERPQNHINLKGDPKDLACGGIYESFLTGAQKDTAGEPIKSDWVAAAMQVLILGAKKPFGQHAYGQYDKCDTDRPANPDNIKYSSEMHTLFIGEDSANHLNNFLWAFNVDSGSLTRILSAPAGAEHTGLQVIPNLNGHTYILGNIQHPGAAEDLKSYPDEVKINLRQRVDQRGMVGYLKGLPSLRR